VYLACIKSGIVILDLVDRKVAASPALAEAIYSPCSDFQTLCTRAVQEAAPGYTSPRGRRCKVQMALPRLASVARETGQLHSHPRMFSLTPISSYIACHSLPQAALKCTLVAAVTAMTFRLHADLHTRCRDLKAFETCDGYRTQASSSCCEPLQIMSAVV